MDQKNENRRPRLMPYDRFLKEGAQALSQQELIAIILRTGTKGEDAVDLACRVLSLCGEKQGILGLHHVSVRQLMQINGIGEVKAVKLKAIAELSRRMAKARVESDIIFTNASQVASVYMEQLRHFEKEHCLAVFLDSKDSRIGEQILSIGNLNGVMISARELFRQALLQNAASVILLHNHPSGDSRPSREDILTTEVICKASEFMEIPLLDHIIIGDNTYTSLKEEGVL